METALLQTIIEELKDIKDALDANEKPVELVDEVGAAEFLGMRPQTLGMWRHKGTGPTYIKVGNAVRYKMSALAEYLEQQTVEC